MRPDAFPRNPNSKLDRKPLRADFVHLFESVMSVVKPVNAPQTRVAVVGDELQVGGVSGSLLVERVGSTPLFTYDRALLPAHVASVRAALPASVRLHYSIKANPMTAPVQHMANLVDGLDVALAQELRIALDTGGKPAAIAFARPGKIAAELRQALAFGICINLELPREIDTVARLACELRVTPRVILRINPNFELKSSCMRMGGGAEPFGIDAGQARKCSTRPPITGHRNMNTRCFGTIRRWLSTAGWEGRRSCRARIAKESCWPMRKLLRNTFDERAMIDLGLVTPVSCCPQ